MTNFGFEKICIKLDQFGRPHIVFSFSGQNFYVYYKYWDPVSGWQSIRLPDSLAKTASFDIDSLNQIHIVYISDNKLMYAIWDGNNWIFDTIISGNITDDVSLILDQDDNPHICFFSNGLYYAYGSPTGIEEYKNNFTTISDFNISPSPFSNLMKINLVLTNPEEIELKLYNVNGALVKDIFSGFIDNGTSDFFWNGKDNKGNKVPQGIYFCQLKTKDYHIIKKLVFSH